MRMVKREVGGGGGIPPGAPKSVLIYDATGNPAVLTGGANNGPVIFDAAGNPVALGRGADAQVLTLPAGGGPPAWATPPALPAHLPTIDGTEYIRYSFDENVLPLRNTGNAGAGGNLDTIKNSATLGTIGLFGSAASAELGAFSTYNALTASILANSGATASGSNLLEIPFPVTMEAWFRPYNGGSAELFYKAYRPVGSWTAPFATLILGWSVVSTFPIQAEPNWGIVVGGVLKQLSPGSSANQTARDYYNRWQYVAGTYDGVNQKMYLNGQLIATSAQAGALDYGTHGSWGVGTSPDNATNHTVDIDECRVYPVAFSAATIAQRWRNAMGWTA